MEEGAIPIFRKSVSGEHNKWRVGRKGKNWFSFPDFFCLEGFFAEAVAERTRQPKLPRAPPMSFFALHYVRT